jgi:hypothetical protein
LVDFPARVWYRHGSGIGRVVDGGRRRRVAASGRSGIWASTLDRGLFFNNGLVDPDRWMDADGVRVAR